MGSCVFNYQEVDVNFEKYYQVYNFLKKNIYYDILNNTPFDYHAAKVLDDKYSTSNSDKFKILLSKPSDKFHDSVNLFINELYSDNFTDFIKKCFKTEKFTLNAKLWISLPESEVMPHYDDSRKIGNIMFYLNQNAKGGETVFWKKDIPVFTTNINDNSTVFMRTRKNKHSVNQNFSIRKVIIVNIWK